MRYLSSLLIILGVFFPVHAQQETEEIIRAIYNEALSDHTAYHNLQYLCKNTAGRISGTPEAAAAVEFTKQAMIELGADSVFLQPVMVPHWERGKVEYSQMVSSVLGTRELDVCGLGLSVGTSDDGVVGNVVEVTDFDELGELGRSMLEGKIVFYNRPLDKTKINTFAAYGGAVNQRTKGAVEAARYGAIATIVRSVTTGQDNVPHTGVLLYDPHVPKIPAICVSTNGADLLSQWLATDPDLNLHMISNCKTLPDVLSYNVVGQINGSVFPEQIISIGGHLDAWDTGEGAHDDGAGCIQSIEVLRLFKELGIEPKRTIRAVMFMDEEIRQSGGKKYAEWAELHGERHYAALEADRGALTPRGFGFGAEGDRLDQLLALEHYFKPFGLDRFVKGGGGADIGPLRKFGTLLLSYIPDDHRYFDYHHSAKDVFETVNERELQMGSASIATLIYLIDLFDL